MPHLSLKRCLCLLLLVLYIGLTVQLLVVRRNVFGTTKPQSARVTVAKSFDGAELSEKIQGEPVSAEESKQKFGSVNGFDKNHGVQSVHASASSPRMLKHTSSPQDAVDYSRAPKEKKVNLIPGLNKTSSIKNTPGHSIDKAKFAKRKILLSEAPFKRVTRATVKQNELYSSSTHRTKKNVFVQRVAKSTANPEPTTLTKRIEQASESGLYSQMRAKLKSLGSAVTEEQLRSAANKCGGKKPALRHVQTYDFVRVADHLCTGGDLLALVAVHTNAKNLERRATIRRTWGSLRYIGRFRIEVAFFLGRPASGDADASGATGAQLEALISAESSRFGDIVQLNYTENYRSMTIKHLAVYEWLLRHCKSAQYLVKVDDDTFTDVAHLAIFLSKGAPSGFYCSATQGTRPQRVRRGANSKWTVSYAEFPGKTYPTYCQGFGYIVDAKHVTDIYLCSLFKKFFWIDDVHVTGTLASSVGVPVTRFWRGHGYTNIVPSRASKSIVDYIFLTAYYSNGFNGLWAKLWVSVLKHSLDVVL